MTNKDLHLALDQNLIQLSSKQKNEGNQTSHDAETANLESITDFSQGYQNPANNHHAEPPPTFKEWIEAIRQSPRFRLIIALLLLFLLLAGLWFTNQSNQSATDSFSQSTSTSSAIKANQAQIETLNNQVLSLQQEVEELKLSLQEQQSLINTNSKDLNKEIQTLAQQLQAFNTQAASEPIPSEAGLNKTTSSKATPTTTAPKKATNHWYVNIGTFSSKKSAQKLQNQLSTLGHAAQINTTSLENKPAYRVQLPGFKDRETAELAARQVMDKTNLNGLWAWKDE
jgi:cell division protein FtsN